MSLDWTGDDIGDRAMSMPRPAALRKVNYVHESVPAPRIPPAELGFDNVDNASQISNDEDTDVELADEHCFICARHGKQHRSSESLPPTPGGWDYQEVQRVFFLPTNSNNVNNFRLVMLPHFLNSYAPATLTKVRLSVSRNLARVGAKTPGLKRLRLQLTTLCSTTLRAGMPAMGWNIWVHLMSSYDGLVGGVEVGMSDDEILLCIHFHFLCIRSNALVQSRRWRK